MAGEVDQPLNPPDATAARGDGREEEEEMEGQAARLPADVLAEILCRVQPRWLAAARCVCSAWRDAVDGRRLLRADLLPLSLAGFFVQYNEHRFPEFLARPSSSSSSSVVSGDLSFLPFETGGPHRGYCCHEDRAHWKDFNIVDHCNGLLLLHSNCVVNPATRRWHTLPTCPAKPGAGNVRYRTHLAYDPMVSPYYEVFKIPTLVTYNRGEEVDPSMEESEWPPSLCRMYVFSSKLGCWEEKHFVREGDAAGTVGEVRAGYSEFSAAYFRGALYIHCETNFLMRVSLSINTYRVIKPPIGLKEEGYQEIIVARSEKGLYFVELGSSWPHNSSRLRVWILDESSGQMEWTLKHDKDLTNMLPRMCFSRRVKWILEDINYKLFRASSFPKVDNKATTEEKSEWNSNEGVEDKDMVDHGYLEDKKAVVEKQLEQKSNSDNTLNYEGKVEDCYYWDEEHDVDFCREDIELLGFHPYKEIVFLSASQYTCLAYHLNDSHFEELGKIYPKDYRYFKELANDRESITSFPYTPCWIEDFPGNN